MENEQQIGAISIVGGTGALGTGLAQRWARAGYTIVIGSRTEAKALEASSRLADQMPEATFSGLENLSAAEAGDIVVMTVPFAHHAATLERIMPGLKDKILIDTTVPLVPPKVARVQLPEGGSAAVRAQRMLGDDTQVISAFQNVAADLMATEQQPECDVLVTGDKLASRAIVIRLAEQAGFRAWHAGPLANSAATEALTSVLIFMNRRYDGSHTGIRVTGIHDH